MMNAVLQFIVLSIQVFQTLSTSTCSPPGQQQSVYQTYCCQPENLGQVIRVKKDKILLMIFCPASMDQLQCEVKSCEGWFNLGYTENGFYNISSNGETLVKVYCNMDGKNCDNKGGWTRVAYFNMTQPNAQCPTGLTAKSYNNLNHVLCSRIKTDPDQLGCAATTFSTLDLNYTEVCGQAKGYQYSSPDAFNSQYELKPIDSFYVNGVSITHGSNPRQHIWTYACGYQPDTNNVWSCPCNTGYTGGLSPPSFVGNHYYCESGIGLGISWTSKLLYPDDPLWDGLACDGREAGCCNSTTANYPWFHRMLNTSTVDDIELRMCTHEPNDDTPLEVFELYVR